MVILVEQGRTIGSHSGCSLFCSLHCTSIFILIPALTNWSLCIVHHPFLLSFLFINSVADRSFEILHLTALCTRSFILMQFHFRGNYCFIANCSKSESEKDAKYFISFRHSDLFQMAFSNLKNTFSDKLSMSCKNLKSIFFHFHYLLALGIWNAFISKIKHVAA